MFEGELVNGKRNGEGKEYDSNNKLIYHGQYKDGNRCIENYQNMILLSHKYAYEYKVVNGQKSRID